MGTILKALCRCGFNIDKIYFGASMEDEGQCFVPALKNGSSTIEMRDIRKQNNNKEYIFYTDRLFYNENCSEFFSAWEYRLMKEKNLCPECKNYEMKFIYVGEYD